MRNCGNRDFDAVHRVSNLVLYSGSFVAQERAALSRRLWPLCEKVAHRQKRSKATIKTEIEGLHGIGKGTASKLLRHFKSVKKIREAPLEELETIVGKKKAEIVRSLNLPDTHTLAEEQGS